MATLHVPFLASQALLRLHLGPFQPMMPFEMQALTPLIQMSLDFNYFFLSFFLFMDSPVVYGGSIYVVYGGSQARSQIRAAATSLPQPQPQPLGI